MDVEGDKVIVPRCTSTRAATLVPSLPKAPKKDDYKAQVMSRKGERNLNMEIWRFTFLDYQGV